MFHFFPYFHENMLCLPTGIGEIIPISTHNMYMYLWREKKKVRFSSYQEPCALMHNKYDPLSYYDEISAKTIWMNIYKTTLEPNNTRTCY